jgi:hypothetical protein
MILGRYVVILSLLGALVLAFGCSKKESQSQSAVDTTKSVQEMTDSAQIQAVLDEVVTRWRYGDKGGFYDMEWEYLQNRYSFDEYLGFASISPLTADTMERMVVTGADIKPKKSAIVYVDVLFKGPTGVSSVAKDTHLFYYDRDRWIRPLAGSRYLELEYQQIKHTADSAAAEEAKLEGH